jgi:diaminopimelate epimerase
MELNFFKYQGTGNDFIIIKDPKKELELTKEQISQLCDRKMGIGADGLMLLQPETGFDFKMVYYNSDGGESSMCGNGGRCLVQFAHDQGLKKDTYHFIAIDGEHQADFDENQWVRLQMQNVDTVKEERGHFELNTGSPHLIVPVTDLWEYDVFSKGQTQRNQKQYAEKGINVNFTAFEQNNRYLGVRTYERGVEAETLSCGTGVTAAALVHAHNDSGYNRVEIKTLGGNLYVEFDKISDTHFENIWLCGKASFVFKGMVSV